MQHVNDVQRIVVKNVANQANMNVPIASQAIFYQKINAKSATHHASNVQVQKITNVRNVQMDMSIRYKKEPNTIAFHAIQIALRVKRVKNVRNAKKATLRILMGNVSSVTHPAKVVMAKRVTIALIVKKDIF